MTTLTFDNHAFIEKLISKGLKKNQAEAIAGGLKESRELDLSQLVTKDYLKAEVNSIHEKIAQLKYDLLIWLLTLGAIVLGSFTGGLFTLYYFLKPFVASTLPLV